MTKSIDVSIVIPTYNSAQTIERTVESILRQADVSFEVIVVNDQGTDDTLSILRAIQEKAGGDTVVVMSRDSAMGQSTARNRGMEAARGRYVAFLDSDDTFAESNTLKKWVAFADRLELEIAGAQYHSISLQGVRKAGRSVPATGDAVMSVAACPDLVNVTSCWQLLYRREFLERTNTRFSEHLRQREDRLFFLSAMLRSDRIGISSQFVVDHYRAPTSSYRTIDEDQFRQYCQHLVELNAIVDEFKKRSEPSDSLQNFIAANLTIYLLALRTYWAETYVGLWALDPAHELVASVKAEIAKLCDCEPVLFDLSVVNMNDEGASLVVEGTIDILRLAILANDDALIDALLRGERLTFRRLADLAKSSRQAERAVCRYLTYYRTNYRALGFNESTRPLSELVERVIFHVGYPKTGTSIIQHTLERNRLRLLEHGFLYPVVGTNREHSIRRERSAGHAKLLSEMLAGDASTLAMLCGEIEAAGGKVHTLILSAENVLSTRFWDHGTGFGKIVSLLGASNVEVICALRRHDELMRSHYREVCANPWNRFTSSAEAFVREIGEEGLLAYGFVLEVLRSPECVSAVHVGRFEEIRTSGGAVPWFARLAGLSAVDLAPADEALSNESLSDAQAATILFAKANPTISRPDLARVFEIVMNAIPRNSPAFQMISRSEMAQLLEPYMAEFTAYCASIGAPVPPVDPADTQQGEFPVPAEVLSIVINSANSSERLHARRAAKATRLRQERTAVRAMRVEVAEPIVPLNVFVPTRPQGIFVTISPDGELVGWAGERGQEDSVMSLDIAIDDFAAQVMTKELWRAESGFRRRYSFQVPHEYRDGQLHRLDIKPTGFRTSVRRCPCYFALTDEACLVTSPLRLLGSALRGAVFSPWLAKGDKAVVRLRLSGDRLLEATCDEPSLEGYAFPGGSFGFSIDLGEATLSQIESIELRHPSIPAGIDAMSLLDSAISQTPDAPESSRTLDSSAPRGSDAASLEL